MISFESTARYFCLGLILGFSTSKYYQSSSDLKHRISESQACQFGFFPSRRFRNLRSMALEAADSTEDETTGTTIYAAIGLSTLTSQVPETATKVSTFTSIAVRSTSTTTGSATTSSTAVSSTFLTVRAPGSATTIRSALSSTPATHGLSGGTKAGIVIGVVALAVFTAMWIFLCGKGRYRSIFPHSNNSTSSSDQPGPHELITNSNAHELPGPTERPYELHRTEMEKRRHHASQNRVNNIETLTAEIGAPGVEKLLQKRHELESTELGATTAPHYPIMGQVPATQPTAMQQVPNSQPLAREQVPFAQSPTTERLPIPKSPTIPQIQASPTTIFSSKHKHSSSLKPLKPRPQRSRSRSRRRSPNRHINTAHGAYSRR